MKRQLILIIIIQCLAQRSIGQDPSFSQFFSSPLNVNPALTANINADWRMIANFRNQWIGPASPYITSTISYDRKLSRKLAGVEEGNVWGIGGMLMYDHAMSGVMKSNYASVNISHRMKVYEGYINKHQLAMGFGAIYGRRYVDFSRIDFEEQFNGTGFNTSLPTGEASLENMKPYISISFGATYSISSERNNLDIGIAGFHLNTPKQTFLKDEYQVLPIRKVAHMNFERKLNDLVILNFNTIYQHQRNASYYSIGGALGYYVGYEQDVLLNAGAWYWSKNAVIPYLGILYKDIQVGLSYDITISNLRDAPRRANSFELSFILRGEREPSGIIHCPWK